MKMTFSQIVMTALASFAFAGCAHMNSVSLTPIPSKRSHVVKAEVSKTIFLAFNFDNDYVNPLVEQLKSQCPNGFISGILTKDETISYLIVFTKRVTAIGFCNSTQTASAADSRKRHPSSDSTDMNGESEL